MRALAMTGMDTASMIPSIIAGSRHAGDAAGRADVGRDALERHDGDGAGILGDLGLLGRDDVHDDAALEHLGEALLGRPGGRFDGHVGSDSSGGSRSVRRPGLAPGSSPVRVGRAPRARDYRTASTRARHGGGCRRGLSGIRASSATRRRGPRSRPRFGAVEACTRATVAT